MKYTDVVSNVNVYGMESAVMGSKYPMSVDLKKGMGGSGTISLPRLYQFTIHNASYHQV